MKNLGFVGRLLSQLTPFNDKLHAYFDEEYSTKQLEAAGFILRRALSVNAPNIAAAAEGTIDVAVPGAQVGMGVLATLGADVNVGLYLRSAHVVSAGNVRFTFANHSAGAIDEAAVPVTVLLVPGDLN